MNFLVFRLFVGSNNYFSHLDGFFDVNLCLPQRGDVNEMLLGRNVLVRCDPLVATNEVKLAPQYLDFAPGHVFSTSAIAPYFVSPTEFWVQLDQDSVNILMKKLDNLALDPDFLNMKTFCPAVDKDCLAFFADDSRWYRAVITDIIGDKAAVHYSDFGNSSSVNTSDLRPLPAEFAELPAQAYKCCLDGAEDFSEEAAVTFANLLLEDEFTVQCTRVHNGTLHVRLVSLEGESLKEKACNSALHTIPDEIDTVKEVTNHGLEAAIVTESSLDEVILQQPVTTNETEVYYISQTVAPNQFWFRLKRDEPKLFEIVNQLRELYQDSSDFHLKGQPIVNQWYGVDHPEYVDWYRAQIKEVVGETVVVYFVDYGDTRSVPITRVRELPNQFGEKTIPAMAILAILKENSTNWPTEVVEKFNKNYPNEEYRVVFVTDESGQRIIESIYIGDQNVSEMFEADIVQESAAEVQSGRDIHLLLPIPEELEKSIPPLIPIEEGDQVRISEAEAHPSTSSEEIATENHILYADQVPTIQLTFAPGEKISTVALVGHVTSAMDIWIQLNPTEVDRLMDEISATDMIDIPTLEPQIGRYCLALYPEDGMWYRAVVDSIEGDQVHAQPSMKAIKVYIGFVVTSGLLCPLLVY